VHSDCLSQAEGHWLARLQDSVEGTRSERPTVARNHLQSGPGVIGAIRIGPSPVHGRGVFAARAFEAGDIVEVCPGLVLDRGASGAFADFAMAFDEPRHGPFAPGAAWVGEAQRELMVLPLGAGAVYNHMAKKVGSNVAWSLSPRAGAVVLRAQQQIPEGAELFIDYGRGYWADRRHVERKRLGAA